MILIFFDFMKVLKNKIFIALIVLLVLIGIGIWASAKSADRSKNMNRETRKLVTEVKEDSEGLLKVLDSDILIGDKDAKVLFIDYASMSCPHCASFYSDAYDQLKEDYIDKGLVKFVYRDFPLNRESLVAAAIAICRANELEPADKAEGYHDFVKRMFDTQNSWIFNTKPIEKLISIAVLEGMSANSASDCTKNLELQDQILAGRFKAAKSLNIQSTPTFFINNKKISGFIGYEKIKEVIEHELK